EIEPLASACRADPEVEGALLAVADSAGNPQEVTTWTSLSDDLVGVMPRLARIVEAAEDLIGGPAYHWHSKLSMKKPGSAGRWDWHQDYGYWYDEGCLRPDMTTCTIAIDPAFRENGCLKLVRASHRLGRIDHGRIGEASGVDPERLALILARFEIVDCVMQPATPSSSMRTRCTPPARTRAPRRARCCTAPTTPSTTSPSSLKDRSITNTGRSRSCRIRRSARASTAASSATRPSASPTRISASISTATRC